MDIDDNGDLPNLPGYMSIKDAAEFLGLSIRRVHEYVQEGKLSGFKAARAIMVPEEEVKKFQRSQTGRPRTRIPTWRLPVGTNLQYLSIIFARVRPGQGDNLEKKLKEIHADEKHLLPGTVARYIARSEAKPDDVQIVLVWRSTVMPPEAEREAALAALRAELAGIVDWDSSWSEYGRVLMHT